MGCIVIAVLTAVGGVTSRLHAQSEKSVERSHSYSAALKLLDIEIIDQGYDPAIVTERYKSLIEKYPEFAD